MRTVFMASSTSTNGYLRLPEYAWKSNYIVVQPAIASCVPPPIDANAVGLPPLKELTRSV